MGSPVAQAAFDLPGRNWVWDFVGREERRFGKDLECNGPCLLSVVARDPPDTGQRGAVARSGGPDEGCRSQRQVFGIFSRST